MDKLSNLSIMALALWLAIPPQANAESLAELVADGQPWASTTPEGAKMTITFLPDGSARMQMGILSKSLAWQPTEDGICLIGTPRGDACMRLEPTENGYVGYKGAEKVMTLFR